MTVVNNGQLKDLVPAIYEDVRESLGLPKEMDMSKSNRCDRLTKELFGCLANRGFSIRRELHRFEGGLWHFVIAHASVTDQPDSLDFITDLNPWQFNSGINKSGYLHMNREELMATLGSYEAPDWFVGLRGINTIVEAHTDVPYPPPHI